MFHPNIHGVPPGHSHGHDHDDPIILDDNDQDDEPYNSDTDTSTSDSIGSRTHRLPAHVLAQQQLSQLQRTQNRPIINPLHQFPTTNGTTLGDSTTTTITETTTTTTSNPSNPTTAPSSNQPTVTATTTTNTHYQTSLEQDKKLRSRIREERHAALCVLLDRELLTVQALAAQESIPQTRRRFLAKLLSPEDPETAASLQGDRFVIQHPMRLGSGSASKSGTASPAATAAAAASPVTPSGADYEEDDRRFRIGVGIGGPITTTGLIVPRQVEEVYETDEAGWRRPPPGGAERLGGGGGGGGGGGSGTNRGSSAVSSPSGRTKGGTGMTSNSSSVATTAGSTPERQRRGIKGRSQRERERERGRARRGLVGGGAGAAASIFGSSLT